MAQVQVWTHANKGNIHVMMLGLCEKIMVGVFDLCCS